MKSSLSLLFVLLGLFCHGQNLIPRPERADKREGEFLVAKQTEIYSPAFPDLFDYLNDHIERVCGYRLAAGGHRRSIQQISIEKHEGGLSEEGYLLDISPSRITIRANDRGGAFYALQTLFQLMPVSVYRPDAAQHAETFAIPCFHIEDAPRFASRGVMLAVSRNFSDKAAVMRYIDWIARHKLNTLHWHLTDDNGWRVEIKKYPELTSRGAWRGPGEVLPPSYGSGNERYGGFYTQQDVREIVDYAAFRNVEIIPEIDLPGHSQTLTSVYPETFCRTSGSVTYKPEEMRETLCAGREENFEMLRDILQELAGLFPSKYIHIGGDEADRTAWKSCPRCRHLARELGGVDQVQCYLVEHAEKFLAEHGRTMIGWDEILKNNLRSTSTVISYRGQRGGIEAANRGYDVVMSPGEILYFDWYQADPHTQPRAMGGFSPIRKMYGFHPVPDTPAKAADNESIIRGEFVSPDSVEYIYDGGKEHVIGVQGCTWTEFIETEKHLEYMIFPRLLAVSELAWTPRERCEWNDFRRRINVHVSLLHARGINAFPLSDDVVITAQMLSEGKKARVTLDTEKYPAEVRYTLDGTAPVPGSDLYDGPFVVKAGTTVRAALFVAGRMEGTMTELYVDARRNVDNYYTYLNTPEVYASTDR